MAEEIIKNVDKVTQDMISFLVKNYLSATIGSKEIKFSSVNDLQHFEENYGR